jgi:hypothetical protein
LGLILHAARNIAPVLVPLAALGLALVMVGRDRDAPAPSRGSGDLVNVAYLALAGFVAWGRFGPESF